jgi:hypothetical protein
MTKSEAEEILDVIRRGGLFLDVTDHFWKRAHERIPGFSTQHIFRVIRNGELLGSPRPSPENNNHIIKIRGHALDFGVIEMVLGLSWFSGVCITIYGIKEIRGLK